MAAQHFGHSGCLRLYHKGTILLYSATQMKQVQDGDLIVVRRSEIHRPNTVPGTPTALSTHQADFTRHPLTKHVEKAGADYESILTERTKGAALDGMSRYAMDYVRHPLIPNPPYQPPSALELHNEPLGTTTYSREFPWREGTPRKALGSISDSAVRQSSLSEASQKERFKGASSYSVDFSWRDGTMRELALSPQFLRMSSVGPPPDTPFSAVSTYASDFQKLCAGRQKSARPKEDLSRLNAPFQGTSEYRREYDEKRESARRECVQLAEEAFEGQTAKELLKLAQEAGATADILIDEVPASTGAEIEVLPV